MQMSRQADHTCLPRVGVVREPPGLVVAGRSTIEMHSMGVKMVCGAAHPYTPRRECIPKDSMVKTRPSPGLWTGGGGLAAKSDVLAQPTLPKTWQGKLRDVYHLGTRRAPSRRTYTTVDRMMDLSPEVPWELPSQSPPNGPPSYGPARVRIPSTRPVPRVRNPDYDYPLALSTQHKPGRKCDVLLLNTPCLSISRMLRWTDKWTLAQKSFG